MCDWGYGDWETALGTASHVGNGEIAELLISAGAPPTIRLTVLIKKRGALMIRREGAAARNLFHLGERVFHPSGAEDIRIRFGAGGLATTLRIEDGPVAVAAKRLQAVPLLD